MSDRFTTQRKASPRARIGELVVNQKTIETPAYFPTIRRSQGPNEIKELLETIRRLNGTSPSSLPNTGGFVIEGQLAPRLLDKELTKYTGSRQSTLAGGDTYSNFYSSLEYTGRMLTIGCRIDN
jgi:hypothetical protein